MLDSSRPVGGATATLPPVPARPTGTGGFLIGLTLDEVFALDGASRTPERFSPAKTPRTRAIRSVARRPGWHDALEVVRVSAS